MDGSKLMEIDTMYTTLLRKYLSFTFRLKTELGTNQMDKSQVYLEFYFHF